MTCGSEEFKRLAWPVYCQNTRRGPSREVGVGNPAEETTATGRSIPQRGTGRLRLVDGYSASRGPGARSCSR